MHIDEGYSAVVISNFYVEIFFQVGFKLLEDFARNRQVTSRVLVHSFSFQIPFPREGELDFHHSVGYYLGSPAYDVDR